MAKKDLKVALAEMLLTGDGKALAELTLDSMIKSERESKQPSDDKLESMYGLRKQLRELDS